MLKYIKNHMATIGGIEIFPIISFLIFFIFFIVLLIWVVRANKEYISHMENLPLENGPEVNTLNTKEA
jgi:cytochrome c oxidase cbb3-type subunit IV